MDIYDAEKRSKIMSRIRGKDTKLELRVRSFLHAAGLRYVLHDQSLPGKPDLSFPSRGLVIFVHGCFWHGHKGCNRATVPATRREFWQAKIHGNKERDGRNKEALQALGWQVRILWQCSITDAALSELVQEIAALPIRRRRPRVAGHSSNDRGKLAPPAASWVNPSKT